jgi:hypothetical protein
MQFEDIIDWANMEMNRPKSYLNLTKTFARAFESYVRDNTSNINMTSFTGGGLIFLLINLFYLFNNGYKNYSKLSPRIFFH